MKINKYISALLLVLLCGCNGKQNSDSTNDDSNLSNIVESSDSLKSENESSDSNLNDYILEENETYTKLNVSQKNLETLTYNSIKIKGIDNLVVDPFNVTYFFNDAIIHNPTSELLRNKYILYTSSWYEQKTFLRDDNCKEYELGYEDGIWYVTNINDKSNNFIPFNRAILSLPSNSSISYKVGDVIEIESGTIPQYDIGLYNQEGKRIAIKAANKLKWNKNGINLYDNNTLSKVTSSAWVKVATINCKYDSAKNVYKVDRFRRQDQNKKVYTNVNDGFTLAAGLEFNKENLAILEGIRFNVNDTIKVEENANLINREYNFSLQGVNTVILDDESKVDFSIEKSTKYGAKSCWLFEVAVNKKNVIVETNSCVNIPEGGYKLALTNENSTTGEGINLILDDYFPIGAKVNVTKSSVTIIDNPFYRIDNLYDVVNNYYNKLMDDIKVNNYAYDINTLEDVKKIIDEINLESFNFLDNEDPTYQYYLYTLTGKLYQQYYRLLSASNRNEIVQVKSCWYINDYGGIDYSLETIQNHLDKLKANGVNEIIVNTMENGKVTYNNSKYFKLMNSINNKDYGEYKNDWLKTIIKQAHERNIKVFACITPLTSGIENVFEELKDCYALNMEGGKTTTTSQGNVTMLDPSFKQVQEKSMLTIKDVLENNEGLDGIHLDYIRFGADNNSLSTVTGITTAAYEGFNNYCKEKNLSYNYSSFEDFKNGLKKQIGAFEYFNEYQQTLITDTVRNIKEVCKEFDKPLTCAVADNYSLVKNWKCQDWGLWAKEGIVDALYLMDYYLDEYYVDYYFKDMVKATNNNCMLVTGIDPSYANLIDEYYAKVVKGAMKESESFGYAIFGTHTQNAKKDGWDLIKPSSWIESLSPYDNLTDTIPAYANMLLQRCDDIYIKYGNMDAKQKQILQNDLEMLVSKVKGDNLETCNDLILTLNNMIEQDYATNAASLRIKEQLNSMLTIVKLKLNILK